MDPRIKKIINISSYLLNIFFFLMFLELDTHLNGHAVSEDDCLAYIQQSVINREKAELPLKVQKFDGINSITIDSLVFTKKEEPYSGYLVTSWNIETLDANRMDKQLTRYVEISNIIRRKDGSIYWTNDWKSAYLSTIRER